MSSHGQRWIIGIQVALAAHDVATASRWSERLDRAIQTGLSAAGVTPGDATLVVFPEHLGTWLALTGGPELVYTTPTRAAAIEALAASDAALGEALEDARRHRVGAASGFALLEQGLVHYQAQRMWQTHQTVCSQLARAHHLTLVAGSLALPPLDRLDDPDAPLFNTVPTFGPDGSLQRLDHKVYLAEAEQSWLRPGSLAEVAPFGTPCGRVGILVCADGWFPTMYEPLAEAEVLLQPSFGEDGLVGFDQVWQGYAGYEPPADVDQTDVGQITEQAAWRKYSLAARIHATRARFAVNPFLSGRLWDVMPGGIGLGIDRRKPEGAQLTEVPTDPDHDTFIVLPPIQD